MKDYYSILGVNEYATNDQIKTAFRTLMKIWHPDVCSQKDAKAKFVDIVEAYEVLNDVHKRQEYDDKREQHYAIEQVDERPTTLFGCLIIAFLIIISLSFVAYIAIQVYITLQGVQNHR